jgi:hypothetical protein
MPLALRLFMCLVWSEIVHVTCCTHLDGLMLIRVEANVQVQHKGMYCTMAALFLEMEAAEQGAEDDNTDDCMDRLVGHCRSG